ncbi:maestro heat-like repeat-containing protein family member 1 isoform X2 [Mauremys reevesii]|uniref:maestro heat-like repeat-containing protein family member 1 isoform X2 n=1 Tax=Mauremys reevesii TaxID=260615 RepID=UPI00193F21B0|nr:maestro heat-like repeat-containing protein family member 1 isoform X2 [Mauremys reevesii]
MSVGPEFHMLLRVSQELIEELPDNSPPCAIFTNSLIAVGNLSTMKPALEPELETHLLRAALHAVFTLGTEKNTTQVQALHKVMPELPDAMLGNLLTESPETDMLHYILEHVNFWIVSRVSQERARAIKSSSALLRYTLPEFDNPAEFPRMGHHVAQLALFISDPAKDISRQPREGIYWLYQLLLHQRGLRKVLLRGAEKILPPDSSAGHPRPPAACQPSWAAPCLLPAGGPPAADGGHARGCHSQSDVPAPHHPALAPGARGASRAVPHLMPFKVSRPCSATPAPCCSLRPSLSHRCMLQPAQLRKQWTDDLILSNQATWVSLRLRWKIPRISWRSHHGSWS